MDLPKDRQEPHAQPNAFGLKLTAEPHRSDATDDPDVYRGGDGGAIASGGEKAFESWARYATSYALNLRDAGMSDAWLEHLARARIRRVRPVFPYAKRSS
jgi:hypothetical protein